MNLNYIIIDTSGVYNFVAVVDASTNTPLVYVLPENMELGGVLNGVFHHLTSYLNKIHGVGVCIGPGNFSSTRVGFSFALGLSHSLNIPIVGYSALEGYLTCKDQGKALLLPLGKKGGVIALAPEFLENGSSACEHIHQLGALVTYDEVDNFCKENCVIELLSAKPSVFLRQAVGTVDIQERKRILTNIYELVATRLCNSSQLCSPDYRSCSAFF